jgi:hypothetical protein
MPSFLDRSPPRNFHAVNSAARGGAPFGGVPRNRLPSQLPHKQIKSMDKTNETQLKTCRKCGIPQLLVCFPFNKATQKHRNPCKACRAAESHALRHHPDHAAVIRERERLRSARRLPYLKQWAREHQQNLRPGRQRRWARQNARLKAQRAALEAQRVALVYRPLLGPFRAVLPPKKRGRPPGGGRGSKSSDTSSPRP